MSQLLFTANAKGSNVLLIVVSSIIIGFLLFGFTSTVVRLFFFGSVSTSLRFSGAGRLVSSQYALFLEACSFLRASTVTLMVAIGSFPFELSLAATRAA